jgi:hypothetical protein
VTACCKLRPTSARGRTEHQISNVDDGRETSDYSTGTLKREDDRATTGGVSTFLDPYIVHGQKGSNDASRGLTVGHTVFNIREVRDLYPDDHRGSEVLLGDILRNSTDCTADLPSKGSERLGIHEKFMKTKDDSILSSKRTSSDENSGHTFDKVFVSAVSSSLTVRHDVIPAIRQADQGGGVREIRFLRDRMS